MSTLSPITKGRENQMANTCFIRILAVCATSAQATELTDRLNSLAAEAEKRQEGFDAEGLFIFDGEAGRLTRGVVLDGWVKWGVDAPHALALVRFLERQTELKGAFIECCTPDSEFYGEIAWTDGRLTARELPYEWWPEGFEYDGGEGGMAELNKALAAHDVEREIKAEEVK